MGGGGGKKSRIICNASVKRKIMHDKIIDDKVSWTNHVV